LARRTATNFDNFLVAHKVPRYIAHIFPLLLLFELARSFWLKGILFNKCSTTRNFVFLLFYNKTFFILRAV
jgi:miniconductance mechanosensitive channel